MTFKDRNESLIHHALGALHGFVDPWNFYLEVLRLRRCKRCWARTKFWEIIFDTMLTGGGGTVGRILRARVVLVMARP